jgi:hypothetical protein
MPKRYPKQARDFSVQLYLSGLSVPEVTRRFNEGTAGLTTKEGKPLPIAITERRVAEYVAEYKAEHGPRPEPEDEELTADSINRVKRRALNILAREVAHLESLPKGRISAKQSTALRQHYATLDDMERRQEIAEKRRSKGKRSGKAPVGPSKAESAIEALAHAEGHSAGHQDGHEAPETQSPSEEPGDTRADTGKDVGKHAGAREIGSTAPITDQSGPKLAAGQASRGLSEEELEEIMGSARA